MSNNICCGNCKNINTEDCAYAKIGRDKLNGQNCCGSYKRKVSENESNNVKKSN